MFADNQAPNEFLFSLYLQIYPLMNVVHMSISYIIMLKWVYHLSTSCVLTILKIHFSNPIYTYIFLWYTRNYTHYELPSCIGPHTCSPPIYTRSSILHTHACAGCDTRDYHLYLYSLAIARSSYTCSRLLMF